jgi:hypothetical protein
MCAHRLRNVDREIGEQKETLTMLDYQMHFAQLLSEDHLRAADRRRNQVLPRDGQARVIRLPQNRPDRREQGRR